MRIRWLVFLLAGLGLGQEGRAQEPDALRLFAGLGSGGFRTENPHGGGAFWELQAGAERWIRGGLAVRGLFRRTSTLGTDHVSICYMRTDGSCWPQPVMADSYWSVEVAGVLSPGRGIPLALVAGTGLVKPLNRSSAMPESGTRALQAAWRLGIELGATGNRRGPRVQLARIWFPAGLLDASSETTISMTVP